MRPAPRNELLKGALGGLLMGLGAMLSFGCNIGGFFSALSALSLSGVRPRRRNCVFRQCPIAPPRDLKP